MFLDSFTYRNHTTFMRGAAAKGSQSFDYLRFFTVQLNL